MDENLLFIIKSYLKEIPAYKNRDIKIIAIKPNIHGLHVIYKLSETCQINGKTINYDKLIEILN